MTNIFLKEPMIIGLTVFYNKVQNIPEKTHVGVFVLIRVLLCYFPILTYEKLKRRLVVQPFSWSYPGQLTQSATINYLKK